MVGTKNIGYKLMLKKDVISVSCVMYTYTFQIYYTTQKNGVTNKLSIN